MSDDSRITVVAPQHHVEIYLDNAQTGGPRLRLEIDGCSVWSFYPRGSPEEMNYWYDLSQDKIDGQHPMIGLDNIPMEDNQKIFDLDWVPHTEYIEGEEKEE